jgi:hypothetical protein
MAEACGRRAGAAHGARPRQAAEECNAELTPKVGTPSMARRPKPRTAVPGAMAAGFAEPGSLADDGVLPHAPVAHFRHARDPPRPRAAASGNARGTRRPRSAIGAAPLAKGVQPSLRGTSMHSGIHRHDIYVHHYSNIWSFA